MIDRGATTGIVVTYVLLYTTLFLYLGITALGEAVFCGHGIGSPSPNEIVSSQNKN